MGEPLNGTAAGAVLSKRPLFLLGVRRYVARVSL